MSRWPDEELRHLLASPLVLFLSVDRQLRFRRVSQRFALVAEGQPPEWYVGRPIFDLFPSPGTATLFASCLETGETATARAVAQHHPRRPEFHTTYWDLWVRPTRDAAGAVDGLTCVLTDATPATRARLDLERQAALLAATTRAMEFALSNDRLDDADGILGPLALALGADTASVVLLDDRGPNGLWLRPLVRWMRDPARQGFLDTAGAPVTRFPGWLDRLASAPLTATTLTASTPPPNDALYAAGYRTYISSPIVAGRTTLGTLFFASLGEARDWGASEVASVRSFAALLGGQLARAAAVEALRQQQARATSLARRLETAIEEERRRVGRELHDGVGQRVGTLKLGLEALSASVPRPLEPAVEAMANTARAVMGEIRRVARNLHPTVIDDLGLPAALEGLVDEVRHMSPGVRVTATIEGDPEELPERLRFPIYRIAQEALQNVVRHARAAHVELTLWREATGWQFAISDDGAGYNLTTAPFGMGARSMRERAELSNGQFEVITAPGEGTIVRITWPDTPAEPVPAT